MRVFCQLILLLSAASALWIPCASGSSATYNYEAYGNTLDGPFGQTSSGPCSAESFVSTLLSISNCSSAPGVVTSASSFSTYTSLHAN